ncbi:MAG: hypothetical protein IPM42_04820 [Saprospiraceae bacterium]|nr:hypothetical protein [Saprospiraceae bacterium]
MNFKSTFHCFLLFLTCLAFTNSAKAQVYFGGGLTFNTEQGMKAVGIQAKTDFAMNDKFTFNGSFAYYLRKETYFAIDGDLHYKFINISDKFMINPFAGINLTRTTYTNTSLNLGVSFRFPTEKMTYYFEPKYIIDNTQFVFAFGVLI